MIAIQLFSLLRQIIVEFLLTVLWQGPLSICSREQQQELENHLW